MKFSAHLFISFLQLPHAMFSVTWSPQPISLSTSYNCCMPCSLQNNFLSPSLYQLLPHAMFSTTWKPQPISVSTSYNCHMPCSHNMKTSAISLSTSCNCHITCSLQYENLIPSLYQLATIATWHVVCNIKSNTLLPLYHAWPIFFSISASCCEVLSATSGQCTAQVYTD